MTLNSNVIIQIIQLFKCNYHIIALTSSNMYPNNTESSHDDTHTCLYKVASIAQPGQYINKSASLLQANYQKTLGLWFNNLSSKSTM